ncbi:MAG: hypothetical protein KR126chlam6_01379 [Candidatus Anoxychlamydiales bacterium]|nr:hypothetical protein [Candidatus Anoxychlamydiales bacterium]
MNKAEKPKRHHYITKSYQELFCIKIKKKRKTKYLFFVYDMKQQKWRPAQPLNEGVELDFQKIDHFIGLDPYHFEKSFGVIEGEAVEMIRKIALQKQIPQSLKEFSPVINLMGLLAGRNVFVRERINRNYRQKTLARLMTIHANKETYYLEIGRFLSEETGWPIFDKYEESLAFLNAGQFKIQVDSSLVVEEMVNFSIHLVDFFGSLNWMLLEAFDGEFITSNKPVNAIWSMGVAPYPPAFGLLNSIVVFPLTSNFSLLGSFSPLPSYRKVDRFIVEGMNWVTANSGATMLYAQKQSFLPKFEGVFHLQVFHRLLYTRLIEKSDA